MAIATGRDLSVNVIFRGGDRKEFLGSMSVSFTPGLRVETRNYTGKPVETNYQRRESATADITFEPDRPDYAEIMFALRNKAAPNATRTVERIDIAFTVNYGDEGITRILMPDCAVSDMPMSVGGGQDHVEGTMTFRCANPELLQ